MTGIPWRETWWHLGGREIKLGVVTRPPIM
jgi:hypothetical protein